MGKRFWGVLGLAMMCQAASAQQAEPIVDEAPVIRKTGAASPFLPEVVDESPSILKDLTPEKLPSVHVSPEEGAPGLLFTADFLLLTPRQSGLDFALVDPKNDLIPVGTMQSLHLKTQAGLRTALSYRLKSGWDVGFAYSFFNTTDSYGAFAPAGGLLYPTLTRPGLINESTSAFGRAQLTINTFDATVGKSWDVDEALRLRFYGGLRFATAYNLMQSSYNGRDADSAFAETRSNFGGVGPMFGTEARVGITESIGIFGKANGGLLTGTQRVKLLENNNGGGTIYTDFHDRYSTVIPFMQLGLGLEFRYNGVFLRGGYEVTQYFDLVDRPVFTNDLAEGKLTRRLTHLALDGFFLQAGFNY